MVTALTLVAGPTQTIWSSPVAIAAGAKWRRLSIDSVHYYDGSAAVQPGGSNAANWTGGYAQGTTQIILDKAPPVGHFVILDQANILRTPAGFSSVTLRAPAEPIAEAITTAG